MLYAHLEICTVGFLLSKWSPCRVPAFFFFLPSKRKENVIKQIPSWGAEPRFLICRQLSFFSIFFFPSVRGQKEKKKRKRKKQNKTRKPHPRVIWARNWMAQYLLTWRPQTPLICQSSPECAPTPTPPPPPHLSLRTSTPPVHSHRVQVGYSSNDPVLHHHRHRHHHLNHYTRLRRKVGRTIWQGIARHSPQPGDPERTRRQRSMRKKRRK